MCGERLKSALLSWCGHLKPVEMTVFLSAHLVDHRLVSEVMTKPYHNFLAISSSDAAFLVRVGTPHLLLSIFFFRVVVDNLKFVSPFYKEKTHPIRNKKSLSYAIRGGKKGLGAKYSFASF